MFQPMVFTNTSSHFCINNLRLRWAGLGWAATLSCALMKVKLFFST